MLNKSEILISKSETSSNVLNPKLFRKLEYLHFEFVSNFEFSASDLMNNVQRNGMIYLADEA